MDEEKAKRRRKGLIGCSLLVGYGLVSAVYGYFRDKDSMDFSAMTNAWQFAILHVVLYGIAGLLILGWYFRDPGDDRGY